LPLHCCTAAVQQCSSAAVQQGYSIRVVGAVLEKGSLKKLT